MASDNNKSKSEAEVRFAKAQKRREDAVKANSEAQIEAKRIVDNTARLRALRLAKEAADAAAPEPKPAKKRVKKTKAAT